MSSEEFEDSHESRCRTSRGAAKLGPSAERSGSRSFARSIECRGAFGCVADADSSTARGSCRRNGDSHPWLESTVQATIQVFEGSGREAEGER
jgi:hypothetical protein